MAAVTRIVKVSGLNELMEKCNFDVLVQPELEDARDTIVGRMMRGGKGAGVKRNTLSSQVDGLSATVRTTLTAPRTKGASWARYQEKVVKGIVAKKAVAKAIERIEQRWAAGNGGA